jgi:hypothetical protein
MTAGHLIIMPRNPDPWESEILSLHLDRDLAARLAREAGRHLITSGEFVRRLLVAHLDPNHLHDERIDYGKE